MKTYEKKILGNSNLSNFSHNPSIKSVISNCDLNKEI